MSKIIDAEDILADAHDCIKCVFMAVADLDGKEVDPLQTVANIASKKIKEAIALLDEYRTDMGAWPEPDGAKPASPAARTKRSGE